MLSTSDRNQWQWPLALSALAGLSTTMGAVIAIIHKPGQAAMAGLLGSAIGVMATVSIVELIIVNSLHNDAFLVCACAMAGGLVYYLLEPLIPKVEESGLMKHAHGHMGPSLPGSSNHSASSTPKSGSSDGDPERLGTVAQRKPKLRPTGSGSLQISTTTTSGMDAAANIEDPSGGSPRSDSGAPAWGAGGLPIQEHALSMAADRAAKSAALLRLGLLMAVTMTLHNMPEGFAVAFSAYTEFGAIMAVAIAVHNIPEGIIIAAPIYAATGSRWKAVGLATASGLSEPLGALAALALLHPFMTQQRLDYLLACVGGLMLAVCVIELWPEARACKNDRGLAIGIAIGAIVMGWTLLVEG